MDLLLPSSFHCTFLFVITNILYLQLFTCINIQNCSNFVDGDLPSVMTCANYLKLPPYSTKVRAFFKRVCLPFPSDMYELTSQAIPSLLLLKGTLTFYVNISRHLYWFTMCMNNHDTAVLAFVHFTIRGSTVLQVFIF